MDIYILSHSGLMQTQSHSTHQTLIQMMSCKHISRYNNPFKFPTLVLTIHFNKLSNSSQYIKFWEWKWNSIIPPSLNLQIIQFWRGNNPPKRSPNRIETTNMKPAIFMKNTIHLYGHYSYIRYYSCVHHYSHIHHYSYVHYYSYIHHCTYIQHYSFIQYNHTYSIIIHERIIF